MAGFQCQGHIFLPLSPVCTVWLGGPMYIFDLLQWQIYIHCITLIRTNRLWMHAHV